MTSKAPKTTKWVPGQVYNSSPVLAADWQTLDEMSSYLASCRHLQMPQSISYPLQNAHTYSCTLRVPAYTNWVNIYAYGSVHPDKGDLPTNNFWIRVKCTTAGTPNVNLQSEVTIGNVDIDGISVIDSQWWTVPLMQAADVPVDQTPFPIAVVWQAEEQELDFEVETTAAVVVHYLWLQSEIVDMADLNV